MHLRNKRTGYRAGWAGRVGEVNLAPRGAHSRTPVLAFARLHPLLWASESTSLPAMDPRGRNDFWQETDSF